jgi:hypothetical protein
MPAVRLGGTAVPVRKYDVIGQDSRSALGFVRHVGLAGEDRSSIGESDELPLVHMGPPLERESSRQTINCAGTIGLTVDEIQQIGMFLDGLESEYEAARIRGDRRQQYVIAPHVWPKRSPDGTVIFRRFSCAGFVIESYREIDIHLLRTDADSLPAVSLETLVRQYSDLETLLQNPKVREAYGIPGEGPWPVALAGYVMNALDRLEEEIRRVPHTAQTGDEFFPARRMHPSGESS